MARVEIGPPLRELCDGRKELTGTGKTVLDLLLDVSRGYPALRSRILRNETEISSRVFVHRGDGAVIARERETAPVDDDALLRLYLFVAGG